MVGAPIKATLVPEDRHLKQMIESQLKHHKSLIMRFKGLNVVNSKLDETPLHRPSPQKKNNRVNSAMETKTFKI